MSTFVFHEEQGKLGRQITLDGKHVCFLGADFHLYDLSLMPGESPHIRLQQLVWTAFHDQTEFRDFSFVTTTENSATISFAYECSARSLRGETQATFIYDAAGKQITLQVTESLTVTATIPCDKDGVAEGVSHFFRTQDTPYHESGVYALEFTDPLPYKIEGPSTPITEDHPEIVAPAWYFNRDWQKPQYQSFTYQNIDGEFRKIPCNHEVTHQKDCWPLAENGIVGCLDNPDKAFVWKILQADLPIVHHLCMWGFDLHFWLVLNSQIKDFAQPEIEAGSQFSVTYEISIPSAEWRSEVVQKQKSVPEFTRDRYLRAETPAYSEGLNHFDEGLQLADVRPFWRRSNILYWDRSEGHSDRNCLSIYHQGYAQKNCWTLQLGQSQFGNPIAADTDYTVTAYVKTNADRTATGTGAARVGIRFLQVENPGQNEIITWSPWAWSEALTGHCNWTQVTISDRSPDGEIFSAEIAFEFAGKGQVWLDDLLFAKSSK